MLLFGGYELFERLWLADALLPEDLRVLHIVRGLLGAALAAAIVARSVLKEGGGRPFDRSRGTGEQVRQLRNRDGLHRTYALWFVKMRWLAVSAVALLAMLATHVFHLLDKDRLLPLGGSILILAVSNLFFLNHCKRTARPLVNVRLQIALDLLILTVLIHQSGGIENPLFVAFSFHVIIAAILLPASEAIGVAAAASLLLGGMTVAELAEVIPHYEIGLAPHVPGAEALEHPAHESAFALGRAGTAIALNFVLSGLVIMVVRELRRRETAILALADEAARERLRLEAVVDASSVGIGLVDLMGGLVWANPRFREWVGDTGLEAGAGLAVSQGRDGDGKLASLGAIVGEAIRDRRPCQAESVVASGDRGEKHLLLSAAPILAPGAMVTQAVVVVSDVSDMKRMQAQLAQAGKMAAIGETAGRIAHEVNNPAGIIAAKAGILLERHLPDWVAEEIRKMEGLAYRIAEIVQRLLEVSRPASGVHSRIDVNQVVTDSVRLVKEPLARRDVEIEIQYAQVPALVFGNANELLQVLLNLFNNGADAMPAGGLIRVLVEVVPQDRGSHVVVRVIDSGQGVSPGLRERIFEPFFTTKPPGKGTGLGLPISQAIMQEHGGTLEYEGHMHGGAAFAVRLAGAEP